MKTTMRLTGAIALFLLPVSSAGAILSNADTLDGPVEGGGGLTVVRITDGWFHLGDQYEAWMHKPNPDGVEWETTFTIPPFSASMATVRFEAASITLADLTVNGISIGVPTNHYPVDPIARRFYRTNLISLPAAAFRPGENTIGFRSLFTDQYDDFEFGNVILYLQ